MKTIRTNTLAAFSIMLLLSCAVAQSMDYSILKKNNTAFGSTLVNGVKSAASSVADAWEKMPDRGQLGVMAENALGELEFHTIVKHPYLTTAAVAAPTIITAGVLAKNAIQNAQAKKALVAAIDLDLLENIEQMTGSMMSTVKETLKHRRENSVAKIADILQFEKALTPLVNAIPNTLPGLKNAWKQFGFEAIEYDRANNDAALSKLIDAYNQLLDELEVLYTLHAEQNAPSTLTVAKNKAANAAVAAKNSVVNAGVTAKNNVVNAGVATKNAVVAHPKSSVAVATVAVAAPVVAKAGLVGKAVAWFNNLDKNAAKNTASKALTGVVAKYNEYQPVVAKAASKGLQFAKNHKGKIGAAAVVGSGLYGMHRYLNNDEEFSIYPMRVKHVTVAPEAQASVVVAEAPETEVIQPVVVESVDSNSQMVGF